MAVDPTEPVVEETVTSPDASAATPLDAMQAIIDQIREMNQEGTSEMAKKAMMTHLHGTLIEEYGSAEAAADAIEAIRAENVALLSRMDPARTGMGQAQLVHVRDALRSAGDDANAFATSVIEADTQWTAAVEAQTNTLKEGMDALQGLHSGMTDAELRTAAEAAYSKILTGIRAVEGQPSTMTMTSGTVEGGQEVTTSETTTDLDAQTMTAMVDQMVADGSLKEESATAIKTAIQGAGNDPTKFADSLVENKDSLAELAMLEATRPDNAAAAATAATGLDNPELQAKLMEIFAQNS